MYKWYMGMVGSSCFLRFEECGVSRAELSAMGARLPRVEEKGEKGGERWKDVLNDVDDDDDDDVDDDDDDDDDDGADDDDDDDDDDDVGHGHCGLGDWCDDELED